MKNVNELRENLSKTFLGLVADEIEYHKADSLANICGKMISSAKLQLEYYALRGETPQIEFLDSADEQK